MIELAIKLAASVVFITAVMFVLGLIYGLIDACVFFPPGIITVLKASVLCVAVSSMYKLFFG